MSPLKYLSPEEKAQYAKDDLWLWKNLGTKNVIRAKRKVRGRMQTLFWLSQKLKQQAEFAKKDDPGGAGYGQVRSGAAGSGAVRLGKV